MVYSYNEIKGKTASATHNNINKSQKYFVKQKKEDTKEYIPLDYIWWMKYTHVWLHLYNVQNGWNQSVLIEVKIEFGRLLISLGWWKYSKSVMGYKVYTHPWKLSNCWLKIWTPYLNLKIKFRNILKKKKKHPLPFHSHPYRQPLVTIWCRSFFRRLSIFIFFCLCFIYLPYFITPKSLSVVNMLLISVPPKKKEKVLLSIKL